MKLRLDVALPRQRAFPVAMRPLFGAFWLPCFGVVALLINLSGCASTTVSPAPPAAGCQIGHPIKNHAKNVRFRPAWTCRPSNADDVAAELRSLNATLPPNIRFRAVGSLHSWSRITETDGAVLLTERLRGLEPASREGTLATTLPVELRNNLFRIEAGTRVREANEQLWTAHGKAFAALGGFDGQRFGGLLPTGTHGSALSHGPLAEMARSLDLVTANGAGFRIEPGRGITDPVLFRARKPDWTLIQEDDYFDASLIHLGAFGVVVSYVVEVRDAFYLREIRTVTTYSRMREILTGQRIYDLAQKDRGEGTAGFLCHPRPAFHFELLVNPLGDEVAVTTRDYVPGPQPEPPYFRGRPERNLFQAQRVPAEFQRPLFTTWLQEHFFGALGFFTATVSRLFPRATPGLVGSAVRLLADKGYTHRSYRVFNVGDGANKIPALSGTLFVPLRNDLYLDAIEALRQEARRFAIDTGHYHDGPVSLRFVRASRAMLAPAEDVCSLELIFGGHPAWAADLVRAYARAIRTRVGDQNVWVHWGQLAPDISSAGIPLLYPRYKQWRMIRDHFDPGGRFLNAWLEKILPEGAADNDRTKDRDLAAHPSSGPS
jgi:hypothetical protein